MAGGLRSPSWLVGSYAWPLLVCLPVCLCLPAVEAGVVASAPLSLGSFSPVAFGSLLGSSFSYLWRVLVVTNGQCARLDGFATLLGAPSVVPFPPSRVVGLSCGIGLPAFPGWMGAPFLALAAWREMPSCEASWRGATGPRNLIVHGSTEVLPPEGLPTPVVAIHGIALPAQPSVNLPQDRLRRPSLPGPRLDGLSL